MGRRLRGTVAAAVVIASGYTPTATVASVGRRVECQARAVGAFGVRCVSIRDEGGVVGGGREGAGWLLGLVPTRRILRMAWSVVEVENISRSVGQEDSNGTW